MPEISVVVPVYNMQEYICRCVDSVLSQSYADFELILVDDGSTDNSAEICDSFCTRDNRVRVIHKVNGGVSDSRNVGTAVALGKYITYVDSDDYIRKDFLENLHKEIILYNADMVLSGLYFVDENDECSGLIKRNQGVWELKSSSERVEYIINYVLTQKNGWSLCTTLFRREIIYKNKILSNGVFAEDLGFVLAYLLDVKKVVSIDYVGYCYFQRAESMMHKTQEEMMLDAMNEVSYNWAKRFFNYSCDWRAFTFMFYLIMENQYCKVPKYGEGFKRYLEAKSLIKNLRWHDKWMGRLVFCYDYLKEMYGEKEAKIRILNSRLQSHHNWRLFCFESAVAYRIWIK